VSGELKRRSEDEFGFVSDIFHHVMLLMLVIFFIVFLVFQATNYPIDLLNGLLVITSMISIFGTISLVFKGIKLIDNVRTHDKNQAMQYEASMGMANSSANNKLADEILYSTTNDRENQRELEEIQQNRVNIKDDRTFDEVQEQNRKIYNYSMQR
jgi:hypothetical protein